MTKKELKEIAKDTLMESISIAYYKIADANEYPEDIKEEIFKLMHQYGTTMAKSINKEFYTQ